MYSLHAIKYPFNIINGRINQMAVDFCHFKQSFSLCWTVVADPLEALQKLLRNFAVPLAKVNGERLLELGHGCDNDWRKTPPVNSLLLALENWKEVLDLVSRPGQRFKGEAGTETAAIHIQSCWRRHVARTAYLSHCRRKWAVETISMSWLTLTRMRHVRKALQARRFRQLENYRSRAQVMFNIQMLFALFLSFFHLSFKNHNYIFYDVLRREVILSLNQTTSVFTNIFTEA